jgi:hypothetical protein
VGLDGHHNLSYRNLAHLSPIFPSRRAFFERIGDESHTANGLSLEKLSGEDFTLGVFPTKISKVSTPGTEEKFPL